MLNIEKPGLPADALLQPYAEMEGAYTDCYAVVISGNVSLKEYVTAFYTTSLFKLERFILKHGVKKPSTDNAARAVAAGDIDKFAAWRVEARADNQLLMADLWGKTLSWFMVAPQPGGQQNATRLYFGTAGCAHAEDQRRKTNDPLYPSNPYGFSQALFPGAVVGGAGAAAWFARQLTDLVVAAV